MKIQTLDLEDNEAAKVTFWKRQFQIEPTGGQRWFDATFGIILPVVCFFFDPIVFRTSGGGGSVLAGEYKPFAYVLSFVSIMSLLAFMLWGEKLKWLNGLLAGLFAAGAVVSLVVGIALFPISLIGLLFVIGALGFTPLFTAFVYWRNAVRAHKTAFSQLGRALSARMMILAALFAIVIPAVVNVNIEKGLETMKNGSATEIRQTARWMKLVSPLADFSSLRRYDSTKSIEQREALIESYEMLTGEAMIY